MNKFFNYIKKNKLILILFIVTTYFFLYQNYISISWDFSSYVLNAKYWFDGGKYFEILRPPLMPIIISIFSFFTWKVAEYIFIILTSFLFMISSVKLAKSIKFNPIAFYAISLNVFVLNYGLINGTELLSLVFLEFFISFLIENNSISGLFLGLSALSRYTGLALFPIIFLHQKIKKIFKSLILFGLTLSLWFFYNYYKFGNFFTSIADQYANNILYRSYIIQPMKLSHFLKVQNILIPFFLIGIIIVIYKISIKLTKIKLKKLISIIYKSKINLIMFFLLFYSIYSYSNIPIKDARYLFSLILPTIYFSYICLNYLTKKKLIQVAFIIFIISLSSTIIQTPYKEYETEHIYNSAITKLDELNLSNCSLMSNSWVILNYLDRPSLPPPRFELLNKSIEEGKIIILFKHVNEPEYIHNTTFIKSFPVIYNNEYIILGNKCTPIKSFKDSYLQQIDKIIFNLNNRHTNQNPCFILFHSFSFFEKTCNFINFNGFKQEGIRALP